MGMILASLSSLCVVALMAAITIRPSIVGMVCGGSKPRQITSQELIDILNADTIIAASTAHNQDFWIRTGWGFRYVGTWNRGAGVHGIDARADPSDILNLISSYRRLKHWTTEIDCE